MDFQALRRVSALASQPRRVFLALFIVLCASTLLTVAAGFSHARVHDVVWLQGKRQEAIGSLPFYRPAGRNEWRVYQLSIAKSFWPYVYADVMADDCLDSMQVELMDVPMHGGPRCHFGRPDRIALTPYLRFPDNKLKMTIRNVIGDTGFDIHLESLPWHLEKISKALAAASLFGLLLFKGRKLEQWGPATFWLAVTGFMLAGLLLFSSMFYQRVHDLNGHLDYIRYIADNGLLPLPGNLPGQPPVPPGWQGSQPPLYYLLAAAFYKTGALAGLMQPAYAVRLLSLIFYGGFLWFSLDTVRYYLAGRYALLAAAMLVFWPGSLVMAGTINNDIAILFSHALTLYLATRWYFSHEERLFRMAWYSAFAALMFKSTALIGLGFMGVMTLLALAYRLASWRFLRDPFLWGIAVVSVGVNFGRLLYYRAVEHVGVNWLFNESINPRDLLAAAPYHYLYFDLSRFIRYPFMYNMHREDLFWNPFLKSMLLGEGAWRSDFLACTLSLLLVLMIVLVLVYFLFRRGLSEADICLPALLLMCCMTGASMWYRGVVPWAPSCDARLVGGVMVPLVLLTGKALEWHREEGRLSIAHVGEGMLALFAGLSAWLVWYELGF